MPKKNREEQLAYLKQYREAHREYHLEKWREFIARNPGYSSKYQAKWRKNNKEKILAHSEVAKALKWGWITKQNCHCGEKAEAHHDDYRKPLEVRWLCRKHHKETHRV